MTRLSRELLASELGRACAEPVLGEASPEVARSRQNLVSPMPDACRSALFSVHVTTLHSSPSAHDQNVRICNAMQQQTQYNVKGRPAANGAGGPRRQIKFVTFS